MITSRNNVSDSSTGFLYRTQTCEGKYAADGKTWMRNGGTGNDSTSPLHLSSQDSCTESTLDECKHEINEDFIGVDEAGLIRSFANCGFSIPLCLGEILTNSEDAESKHTGIHITKENAIKFIDTGKTLTVKKINKMLTLYSENHALDYSKGRNGIGFKAAAYNISRCKGIRSEYNKALVTFFCNDTGKYYKFFIDWCAVKKLTDSNDPEAWTKAVSQSRKPVELTGEEKESFLNERKNFTFSSTGGVTIKVGFSDELYQNVKDQFDPLKVAISSERLDHILGTYDMETYLLDELVGDSSPKKLELYKPFDQPMNEYHRFVEYRILYNKTFGFWYLVPLLSTTITERGFSFPKAQKLGKKNTFVNTEEEKEEIEFEFTFRATLPTYMDESKVYTRTDQHGIEHSSMWWDSGATEVLTKYEAKYRFFEANTTENRWGMQFKRNSQFIKSISLEPEKRLRQVTSNFRAFRVRSDLLYKTISKQDNPMDSKMGIQFNKNQYNSENFPSDLKEFLRRIQMKHALEWRKELVERQKKNDIVLEARARDSRRSARDKIKTSPLPEDEDTQPETIDPIPDSLMAPVASETIDSIPDQSDVDVVEPIADVAEIPDVVEELVPVEGSEVKTSPRSNPSTPGSPSPPEKSSLKKTKIVDLSEEKTNTSLPLYWLRSNSEFQLSQVKKRVSSLNFETNPATFRNEIVQIIEIFHSLI